MPSFYILNAGIYLEGRKRNYIIGPISLDKIKEKDNLLTR